MCVQCRIDGDTAFACLSWRGMARCLVGLKADCRLVIPVYDFVFSSGRGASRTDFWSPGLAHRELELVVNVNISICDWDWF